MKFLMAILVYLVAAVVLGLGILLTMRGNPWLLISGVAGYIILLGAIGCRPPKESH